METQLEKAFLNIVDGWVIRSNLFGETWVSKFCIKIYPTYPLN